MPSCGDVQTEIRKGGRRRSGIRIADAFEAHFGGACKLKGLLPVCHSGRLVAYLPQTSNGRQRVVEVACRVFDPARPLEQAQTSCREGGDRHRRAPLRRRGRRRADGACQGKEDVRAPAKGVCTACDSRRLPDRAPQGVRLLQSPELTPVSNDFFGPEHAVRNVMGQFAPQLEGAPRRPHRSAQAGERDDRQSQRDAHRRNRDGLPPCRKPGADHENGRDDER